MSGSANGRTITAHPVAQGKPPTLLRVNTDGTTTDVVLVDRVNTLRCIAGLSEAVTVGLGMPGIVDSERRVVTDAVNLGLSGRTVAVATMVGRALELPTCLDNDVRAASLETLRLERQRDPEVAHLLLLNLGTGVAAAIVQNGVLLRGPIGDAAEIGHVPIPGQGEPCRCGRNGCLETLVSGPALARRWPRDHPHPVVAGAVEEPSLRRDVGDRHRRGVRGALVACGDRHRPGRVGRRSRLGSRGVADLRVAVPRRPAFPLVDRGI